MQNQTAEQQNTEHQAEAAVTLDEIRRILADLPRDDATSVTTGFDKLGTLAPAVTRLAQVQERAAPQLAYPRIAVFAAAHGCAGPQATELTRASIAAYLDSDAPVNAMAAAADAELQLYELDIDTPGADFKAEPAMSSEDTARAIAYGMMAAQPGMHLLCMAAPGAGAALSAQALIRALTGQRIDKALFDTEALDALATHPLRELDPLALLSVLGGFDIAAMLGALIAAKLAKIPVVIEDTAGLAAVCVLHTTRPELVTHCLFADGTGDALSQKIVEMTGLPVVSGYGLKLDAGGASALAVQVLKTACAASAPEPVLQ